MVASEICVYVVAGGMPSGRQINISINACRSENINYYYSKVIIIIMIIIWPNQSEGS